MVVYKVWLEPLPATKTWTIPTPGGYYDGHKHNWPIYSRDPVGLNLTKEQAVRVIDEARRSGYACRAEPPFSITKDY